MPISGARQQMRGRGAVARGDLLDLTPQNFDAVMSVNLRGTAFLSQAVARAMLSREATHPRGRS